MDINRHEEVGVVTDVLENDPYRCFILKENYKAKIHEHDVRDKKYYVEFTRKDADALVVSLKRKQKRPLTIVSDTHPCQKNSYNNAHRDVDSEESKMIFTVIDFVRVVQPDTVIVENVYGLPDEYLFKIPCIRKNGL